MLKNFKYLILLMILTAESCGAMSASDNNIFIAEREVTCRLTARDGKVTRAKITDAYQLEARRVAETGMVVKFYDRNSMVDKAESSAGKAVYRAWEDGDLFYTGTRVCILPVEVKPGKRGTAKFTVTYQKPELIDDILLCSSRYDIGRERVVVNIPAEVAQRVSVNIFNGTGRERMSRDTDADGNVTVTVSADSICAFERQPKMPEPMACMPVVRVSAAFADLGELYGYVHSLLEDADRRYPPVTSLAQSIAAEAGPRTQDRIDAVAAWVRNNIRYVAIEHGEMAHRPDSAVAVLQKRYGDCKGSANLICALLRAIGIDGRRVWIGTRGDVAAPFSKSPNLAAANHMIAAAFVGDSIIYLDGTVSHAPRGYVPQSIAGQECMIENGDTYILARVGDACPRHSVMCQRGRYCVDGTRLVGAVRFDMTGAWSVMTQSVMESVTASRRAQVPGIILAGDRKSITVDSAELIVPQTLAADTTTIVAKLCDNEGVKAIAGRSRLYVMPRLLRMSQPSAVDARKRRYDIDNHNFLPVEADVTIVVPEGYEARDLPQSVTIDNPWFEGAVTYSAGGDNTVRCRARLYSRRTEAKSTEAEAWNSAVREVESASNAALVLTRK